MMPVRPIPTERFTEVLLYNPENGEFKYKIASGKKKAGDSAGTVGKIHGYKLLSVDGHQYLAHRVAWALHYGEQPPPVLDHVNRDRLDNRISNLREATTSHNAANCGMRSHNSSGFRGVHFCKQTRKWRADITIDGKVKNLGRYKSKEEAHNAWLVAADAVHGHFVGDQRA